LEAGVRAELVEVTRLVEVVTRAGVVDRVGEELTVTDRVARREEEVDYIMDFPEQACHSFQLLCMQEGLVVAVVSRTETAVTEDKVATAAALRELREPMVLIVSHLLPEEAVEHQLRQGLVLPE
jgi:hypothetical protein